MWGKYVGHGVRWGCCVNVVLFFWRGGMNVDFLACDARTHARLLCLWCCVRMGCAAACVLANLSLVAGVFVAATIRVTS